MNLWYTESESPAYSCQMYHRLLVWTLVKISEDTAMTIDDIFDGVIVANRGVNLETFEKVIHLAVELAREGREGRKIGALFCLAIIRLLID